MKTYDFTTRVFVVGAPVQVTTQSVPAESYTDCREALMTMVEETIESLPEESKINSVNISMVLAGEPEPEVEDPVDSEEFEGAGDPIEPDDAAA